MQQNYSYILRELFCIHDNCSLNVVQDREAVFMSRHLFRVNTICSKYSLSQSYGIDALGIFFVILLHILETF